MSAQVSLVRNGQSGPMRIGRDFVDAVTGAPRSRGWVERVRGITRDRERIEWTSTLDCATSERAIRKSLADYGCELAAIMSQAVDS